jgi:hypothetical protein
MFNTILIIVRRGKIAVTEAVSYLITRGDEMAIEIGTVRIPRKLYFYGASLNICIYINSVGVTPVFSIDGSHSNSVRAWGQFERGAEAIVITASPHKS